MSSVVTRGLVKRFDGGVEALKGVDLDIREGETFSILGPNGAGKSTLINILTTTLRPSAGDALIAGHSVLTDPDAVRRSIGIVFQQSTLDGVMSAEENLQIHGKLYKMEPRDLAERIPQMLELAGLADRAQDRVQTYSGGMRRRLEIVRAILHRPKVLLLDEPTVALDPQSRRTIWEHITRLHSEFGMTVLLTTHYMDEADSLSDRIAIVDQGKLVALDTPSALKGRLGGDTLEIVVEGDAQLASLAIKIQPGVLSVKAIDQRILVQLSDPEHTIPSILHEVADAKVRVQSMRHRPSTMDDVFLRQTGKAPRDRRKPRSKLWSLLRGD